MAGLGYLGMPGMIVESGRAVKYGSTPFESMAGATVSDLSKSVGTVYRAMNDPENAVETITRDFSRMITPNMPGSRHITDMISEAFQ